MFRFRKHFDILGKFLVFTVSRRGVSLNLHAGLFSRSWGTRGTSTTIDMPGHTGLFWRKTKGNGHSRKLNADDQAYLARHRSVRFGRTVSGIVITVEALIELGRLHIHLNSHGCTLTGHPQIELAVLVAGQIAALSVLTHHIRGIVLILSTVALAYLQWKLFGAWVMPALHCAA